MSWFSLYSRTLLYGPSRIRGHLTSNVYVKLNPHLTHTEQRATATFSWRKHQIFIEVNLVNTDTLICQ